MNPINGMIFITYNNNVFQTPFISISSKIHAFQFESWFSIYNIKIFWHYALKIHHMDDIDDRDDMDNRDDMDDRDDIEDWGQGC